MVMPSLFRPRREEMTEVSPISPLVHLKGHAVILEDVLITSELAHRRPRVPDYASENRTLVALAQVMAVHPRTLPQTLVDLAVDLCRAGTAGISVLEADTDGEYLRCEVVSGVYAPYIRRRTPRLKAEAEHVTLSVRDTGIGFPEGFDFRNTESLGLQLVGMLAEQLGGTLTLTHEGGTTFTVSIPAGTRQM
jgi:signal transduction histidine kinase